MSRIRNLRPTPGSVIAVIALFLALGGVSYGLSGSGTVFKDDIVTGAVGKSEIRPGAVKKSEAGKDSIGKSEAREDGDPGGGFSGDQIDESSLGPVPKSRGFADDAIEIRTASVVVPGNTQNGDYLTRAVTASCDSGERAVSGGTNWNTDGNNQELTTVFGRYVSDAGGNPIGYRARGGNDNPGTRTFTVQVLCTE